MRPFFSPRKKPRTTVVVNFYSLVFKYLQMLAPLDLIRQLKWTRHPKIAYIVVEGWVVLNFLFALVLAILASQNPNSKVVPFALIYGVWRVFEIIVVQTNILLFDELRSKQAGKVYSLKSYRRMCVLLLHNYFELIFWFTLALIVALNAEHISGLDPSRFIDVFKVSMLSMFSFSFEGVKSTTEEGAALFGVQSAVGFFMTVLTLSRFIALLPAPETQEKLEKSRKALSETRFSSQTKLYKPKQKTLRARTRKSISKSGS